MAIDLHSEFPQDPAVLYLNHAAVAPWPARSRDAVTRFAEENARSGARHYPRWLATEQHLREQLRTLIGAASADDIALLKNTSEGLSVIASGLNWQPGDRILISDQEFPSNRIPWQALARQGVEVVAVSLDGDDPEGALIAAMDDRVRLLAISAVQFGSGLRLDMPRLVAFCSVSMPFRQSAPSRWMSSNGKQTSWLLTATSGCSGRRVWPCSGAGQRYGQR